ncbi:hypothetical protein IEQ34_009743 [Dendrobium chrysotoxum]|uniref:Bulb-type lectin domain-containing protein n=1 Tax=Dendrobium chrysotoxum TaxID=161865 RepID=A0AAV7H3A8_DENCH|nr:hypothetical protein IEQ34_009743 [Dendrobium chrysotoxum]
MASSSFRSAIMILLFTTAFATVGSADDHLDSGKSLNPGESLQNDVFALIMQNDCNLVLLLPASNSKIWESGTDGSNCTLQMQYDGNLVIYSDFNAAAIWATNTKQAKSDIYHLILQSDRNLVIYDNNRKALWDSDTSLGK